MHTQTHAGDTAGSLRAHQAAEPFVGKNPTDFVSERLIAVDDIGALNNLGAALLAGDDALGAVERLQRASALTAKLGPTHGQLRVEVHYNLGIALRRTDDAGSAVVAYDQAIMIAKHANIPDSANVHLNKGIALQAVGEIAAATASLEHAMALGHPNQAAIANLIQQLNGRQQ